MSTRKDFLDAVDVLFNFVVDAGHQELGALQEVLDHPLCPKKKKAAMQAIYDKYSAAGNEFAAALEDALDDEITEVNDR